METYRFARSAACAVLVLAPVVVPAAASGQGALDVFHSTQSMNLPTATTLPGGTWMFEISHRFLPPVSEGSEALWGLDGPVRNRLGLAYAPSGRLTLGLLRSNFDDNLELDVKTWLLEGRTGEWSYEVAAMAGVAFNFGAVEFEGVEDNEAQYYAMGILDVGIGDRLAFGIVPTAFRNPRIEDVDPVSTFTLGLHGQYYATRSLSLIGEWILSVESVNYPHDGASFGFEIETLGHFFKLLLTNQVRMNPTQFLVGTPLGYGRDDWHLGFNITRALEF
jgi:hypothetical protein